MSAGRRQFDRPDRSHVADPGRPGIPHGQTPERYELLHPPQRKTEEPGRLLHPARRRRHPGGGLAAGPRPLPRTHGLQRHEESARQTGDRVPRKHRREVRRQPQRRNGLGPDDLSDEGRADPARRRHRQRAARAARLVALHRPRTQGDRLRARRHHGGAPHARRRLVAFDDGPHEGLRQRLQIRAPQPDRLPRRAEELRSRRSGGVLQHLVPSGLPGRDRGRRHQRGCRGEQDQGPDGRHPGPGRRCRPERGVRRARQRSADRQHLHRSRNAGLESPALHQAPGHAEADQRSDLRRDARHHLGLHDHHGQRPSAGDRHAARRSVPRCRHGHGRRRGHHPYAQRHGLRRHDAGRPARTRLRGALHRAGEGAPPRLHAGRVRACAGEPDASGRAQLHQPQRPHERRVRAHGAEQLFEERPDARRRDRMAAGQPAHQVDQRRRRERLRPADHLSAESGDRRHRPRERGRDESHGGRDSGHPRPGGRCGDRRLRR